jgi:hypothetical protein
MTTFGIAFYESYLATMPPIIHLIVYQNIVG